MGKNLWLGRYELIKDNPKKFSEKCSMDGYFNKKLIAEAGKPDKLALWNFICNPRDNLMKIGWHNPPIMGYENEEYMLFFQRLCQKMWTIFEPIFSRYLPIVSLSEAIKYDLYGAGCLREQFPGPSFGNAPGYPRGSFKKRQIGGWRWFSLILQDENWNGEWHKELIPPKLLLKERIAEKLAPKYYNSYVFKKDKWKENKNGRAIYKCPSGCHFIPRRYSFPVVVGNEDSKDFIERYKKCTNIILKQLKTQWTLNVWNICSFDYKPSDISETIIIKPEINISIGWIETYALGKKQWGEVGEGLHRHHENVYNVRVGLPDDYNLELKPIINREKNPIWDGSTEGIAQILEEPYSKLVDLAGIRLNKLILDGLSEFKPEKSTLF
ncbi:MAG: hypothetical protein EU532_10215 [Promethearchaeota archaeon]|nr:MAG: hypothetical protein EU532_10215 [Candidatus Lokiarchaeota archaeon]